MIKELWVQNFKRFPNKTFRFTPSGVSLLAGGNNSGKSTALQALAIWEFCRGAIEAHKGRDALSTPYSGEPIRIAADRFSPLAIPRLDHLWTNLNPRAGYQAGQPDAAYTLRLRCTWDAEHNDETVERFLEFGLKLTHERLSVKPIASNVINGEAIPRCAYLPSFAGIATREERLSRAMQSRLVGRGLAGAALRNILFDLHAGSHDALQQALAGRRRLRGEERRQFYRTDPWLQLRDVLQRVFRCDLRVKSFDERYDLAIAIELFRGEFQDGQFRKHAGYRLRDIMVEGSGLLQWLSVYALAVAPDINVLLLDEPDAHLHPSLQGHLLERLRSLARENSKQVLLSTHSTELLRRVEADSIYGFQDGRTGYLNTSSQRVALFEGLGSEYSPKLDEVRRHRRIIFHEGSFDESILRRMAETMGQALPQSLVFWQSLTDHPQRRMLFEELLVELPGLRAMSLRDRDSLELAQVGLELREHNHEDRNGFLCRTLRRRHLENYLLCPAAIARASGHAVQEVTDFINDTWGVAVGGDLVTSDCPPGLRDARGKEILHEGIRPRGGEPARESVEAHFGCTRHQIAEQMTADEIPEDIRRLVGELQVMCQV